MSARGLVASVRAVVSRLLTVPPPPQPDLYLLVRCGSLALALRAAAVQS